MGAKSAFKIDEWFNKFASPIMSAGGAVGRLIGKLPLLLPLPVPMGGAAGADRPTILGGLRTLRDVEHAFISPTGRWRLPEALGGGAGPAAAAGVRLADHINMNVTVQQNIRNEVTRFNNAAEGAAGQTIRDEAVRRIREELQRAATNTGVTIDLTNNRNLIEAMRKITEKIPSIPRLREDRVPPS
jgi:hypothetical protein